MRRWTWLVVVAAMSAMALPPPVTAQTSEAVGVVTTMDGRANVARPALTVPLALKFKDDVFGRDRISTEEHSFVRVLLGGKAILTVRELSQVTISEEPGRAVVTLPDGKVVLAVAKQRLRPGESIEIRTPNAVAAVRGSSMAVTHVAARADTIAICGSGVASGVDVTGAGSGSGSSSLILRLVSMVDRNSSLARRNSRMARPRDRPSWGRFFGPNTRRAMTKMRASSCRPMSNMDGRAQPPMISPQERPAAGRNLCAIVSRGP